MHCKYATFLIAILIIASPACKFKEGCTDRQAKNFNEDAVITCCCEYSGEAVFYFDQHTSDSLIANGITTVHYYIDSLNVANTYAGIYWDPPPSCGQDQAITLSRDLGHSKSGSWLVKMFDQHQNLLIEKTVTWRADTCVQMNFSF